MQQCMFLCLQVARAWPMQAWSCMNPFQFTLTWRKALERWCGDVLRQLFARISGQSYNVLLHLIFLFVGFGIAFLELPLITDPVTHVQECIGNGSSHRNKCKGSATLFLLYAVLFILPNAENTLYGCLNWRFWCAHVVMLFGVRREVACRWC